MYVINENIPPEKQIQEWSKNDTPLDINNLPEGWDYYWESTAEEDLIEESYIHQYLCESGEIDEPNGDKEKLYQPWDVLFINTHDKEGVGKHRIVVVDSAIDDEVVGKYEGFLLSSKIDKANKNSSEYPNNLYINDYSTILSNYSNVDKPVILKIDEKIKFTNENLSEHGSWKGHANKEFQQFVRDAYNNYKNGRSELNATKYWEK